MEIDNEKNTLELEGHVTNTEIQDLNLGGFSEVLIYTTSAGNGSYGDVIAYSVYNGKLISQICFPELSKNKKEAVDIWDKMYLQL